MLKYKYNLNYMHSDSANFYRALGKIIYADLRKSLPEKKKVFANISFNSPDVHFFPFFYKKNIRFNCYKSKFKKKKIIVTKGFYFFKYQMDGKYFLCVASD